MQCICNAGSGRVTTDRGDNAGVGVSQQIEGTMQGVGLSEGIMQKLKRDKSPRDGRQGGGLTAGGMHAGSSQYPPYITSNWVAEISYSTFL